MPRQMPKVGDVFAVPLEDGTYVLGQVLETRPILMNSMTCAFFDIRVRELRMDNSDLAKGSVISCQFVTRDAFNRAKWKRIANIPPVLSSADLPYRDTENVGWVGAKVIGSGIIQSFLRAYFGLAEWAEMKDPKYYDRLLFGSRQAPNNRMERTRDA